MAIIYKSGTVFIDGKPAHHPSILQYVRENLPEISAFRELNLETGAGQSSTVKRGDRAEVYATIPSGFITGLSSLPAVQSLDSDPQDLAAWRMSAETSRLNFCLALAREGYLDGDSAAEAAKGDWPAAFSSALDGLPADKVAEAKIVWAGASTVARSHPLIAIIHGFMIAQGMDVSEEDIDRLFTGGAA